MAAKKKAAGGKASGGDLIISKSRTKAAAKKCNVGSEFYGALDKKVRAIIAEAEGRATGNKRKTRRDQDLKSVGFDGPAGGAGGPVLSGGHGSRPLPTLQRVEVERRRASAA